MKKFIPFIIACAFITSCDALNPSKPTQQAVINNFFADVPTITLGQGTNLRWDAQGPSGIECRIDPLLGNVASVGVATVYPLTTTQYTLTCSINGQGPAVRTFLVTVK